MDLVQYREIVESEHYNPLVCKLSCLPKEVIIQDYYCVNPECKDHTIELRFYRDPEEMEPLFYLTIGSKNTLDKVIVKDKELQIETIIEEILQQNHLKKEVMSRKEIVNKRVKKNPYRWVNVGRVGKGDCVSYQEVFGHLNEESLSFVYRDNAYCVHDYYCINVDCNCKDAILVFKKNKKIRHDFSIYANVNTFKYKINHCRIFFPKKRAHEIATFYLDTLQSSPLFLKKRRQSMKKLGRYLKKTKKKEISQ